MANRAMWALLAVVVFGALAPLAAADDEDEHGHGRGRRVVVIQNYGVSPFLYHGYSYIPLKSAADFLGAALLWDSLHNRATITYDGRKLGLVVGSTTAYYGGRAVSLPAPPVMFREQVVVPAVALDHYLGVPVQWDDEDDRVMIQGRPGWGYYQVLPEPPVEVVRVIEHGGPPPWAPAHGYRRKQGGYYATGYPMPFVYSGITYVPLRDVASLVGAALLWDSLRGSALITFNGREIELAIGSPTIVYGGRTVILRAAPVVVRDTVYVPEEFCQRYLETPTKHSKGVLKVKGPRGWHDFRLASSPPGHISFGKAKRTRYLVPGEPARVRSHGKRGRERGEKARGRDKQRGKERKYRVADSNWGKEKRKGGGTGKWKAKGGEGKSKVKGGKGKWKGQSEGGSKGKHKGWGKHGGKGDD